RLPPRRAKVWDYVDSELAHVFNLPGTSLALHFVWGLVGDFNERYARCIGCSSHVLNIMLFMVFYKSLFQKYWENPNIVLEEILPRRFFGYSCDAAGRILGKNRTSLSPETLEALKVNYHIKYIITIFIFDTTLVYNLYFQAHLTTSDILEIKYTCQFIFIGFVNTQTDLEYSHWVFNYKTFAIFPWDKN
ncbi:hypothetical protein ACJX0J_014630, partial [Zea mays]